MDSVDDLLEPPSSESLWLVPGADSAGPVSAPQRCARAGIAIPRCELPGNGKLCCVLRGSVRSIGKLVGGCVQGRSNDS